MTNSDDHGSKAGQLKRKTAKSSQTKKISLGKIVEKAAEIIKKPFQRNKNDEEPQSPPKNQKTTTTKPRRRKKEMIAVDYPTAKTKKAPSPTTQPKTRKGRGRKKKNPTEEAAVQDQFLDNDDQDYGGGSSSASDFSAINSEVNGFFYTNDKFISTFEDSEILKYLRSFYPVFMRDPSDFSTQKKQIIEMLSNAKFMDAFLKRYDITIFEFFKFLFRLEPDLFKGSFLKRVQKAMKYKKYAVNAKRTSYSERKRARLSALRQNRRNTKL